MVCYPNLILLFFFFKNLFFTLFFTCVVHNVVNWKQTFQKKNQTNFIKNAVWILAYLAVFLVIDLVTVFDAILTRSCGRDSKSYWKSCSFKIIKMYIRIVYTEIKSLDYKRMQLINIKLFHYNWNDNLLLITRGISGFYYQIVQ